MIRKLQSLEDKRYHRPIENWISLPIQNSETDVDEQTIVAFRKPALRWRRGVFAWSATAFIVGLLIILFNSPFRNELLVPGPLCSSHAQILSGQGADRCSACHAAAEHGFVQWIKDTFTAGREIRVSQSDLCMKCHQETLVNEFALNPHNVRPTTLKEKSSNYKAVAFRISPPTSEQGEIACSACHREHHGQADLTLMTDKQCQTCHSTTFDSFESGHPEFNSWPVARRQRIAFDHTTHGLKHFPEKSTEFNCRMCHVDDAYGTVKTLANYDVSCAKCHNQQIHESSTQGLHLVALPILDLDAVKANGLTVGQWPTGATGDFDGVIPPVTRLLLSADPKTNAMLQRMGDQFEFADIDPQDAEQVADAVKLAWAIKYLLFDLSESGPAELKSRIERTLGRSLDDFEYASLTQGLDTAVFKSVVSNWMPRLSIEVPMHRAGKFVSQIVWIPESKTRLAALAVEDPDELVANPLKKLLGRTTGVNSQVQPIDPVKTWPRKSDGTKRPKTRSTSQAKRQAGTSSDDRKKDPDFLALNPLQQKVAQEFELSQNNPPLSESPTTKSLVPESAGLDVPERLAVARDNGWFRNDHLLEIIYIPTGHSDDYVTAWMDVVTGTPAADLRTETKPLFEKLTSWTGGFGNCSTCHTVDQTQDTSFVVNWSPVYRDPSIREFTKFSHGPHLVQPHLRDCQACHTMDESLGNAKSFTHFNATHAISNFAPITKSNCTSCHATGKSDNSCAQCHNYHVGSHVLHVD